eukprot:2666031-Pyramimonas_sp.AAC.1
MSKGASTYICTRYVAQLQPAAIPLQGLPTLTAQSCKETMRSLACCDRMMRSKQQGHPDPTARCARHGRSTCS